MLHVIAAQAIIILVIAMIIYIGEHHKEIHHRIASRLFGGGIIIAELVLMSLLIYAKEAGVGYNHLLLAHFWIMFIALGGFALFGLIKAFIILVNPNAELQTKDESKDWIKWRR